MTTGWTPRRRRAARTMPGSAREVWLATMMLPAAGAVAWSDVTVRRPSEGTTVAAMRLSTVLPGSGGRGRPGGRRCGAGSALLGLARHALIVVAGEARDLSADTQPPGDHPRIGGADPGRPGGRRRNGDPGRWAYRFGRPATPPCPGQAAVGVQGAADEQDLGVGGELCGAVRERRCLGLRGRTACGRGPVPEGRPRGPTKRIPAPRRPVERPPRGYVDRSPKHGRRGGRGGWPGAAAGKGPVVRAPGLPRPHPRPPATVLQQTIASRTQE
ncbi:hypothetical protein SBADM41S_05917 [Streptomyces badius]